jgi:hypothetical protein
MKIILGVLLLALQAAGQEGGKRLMSWVFKRIIRATPSSPQCQTSQSEVGIPSFAKLHVQEVRERLQAIRWPAAQEHDDA